MKYGMNLLLWTAEVTEEHYPVLNDLKSYGYDGVELPVFEMDMGKFTALGNQLDAVGLERTAVTICTEEENPISPDAAIRQAGLERLKRVIDVCQAAGVTHICGPMHSALGQFSGAGATADEWERAKEILAQAAEHAQQANILLTLEYLNRFECYFLNSAADCARFVREVNHPSLQMMYDSFHANIEEKSAADAIRECAGVLGHVHISENDRATPGEGNVDWDATFSTLKELNYDGWMTVEAFGLSMPELAAATKIWRKMYKTEADLAKDALAFMKSRWEN